MRLFVLLLALLPVLALAQPPTPNEVETDEKQLRELYDEALTNGQSYENLRYLCKQIGHRLSGSPSAQKAVEWGKRVMRDLNLDTVYLQEIEVPVWVRGDKEVAFVTDQNGASQQPLHVCALGGSVATPKGGFTAEVVEVQNFEELKQLGRARTEGKIVLYNRPMDPRNIDTFRSYGGCVDQRAKGAMEAAEVGAVAVLVRSMGLRNDDFPHTGSMYYDNNHEHIPAAAISTNDADALHKLIKKNGSVSVHLEMSCSTQPDMKSYNVIGELWGAEFPDEIIAVGGHLDSWDVGEGAHDDGAGIVQSMEVLRLFKATGIRPRHTIRAILFMNEENGNNGGKTYAAKCGHQPHIVAMESDRGGFSPRGFNVSATKEHLEFARQWEHLFKPYGANRIEAGYAGVDIGPLADFGVPLIGLVPDSQRYFDHHHCDNDVFEEVNQRELELGGASMAALLFLIDKYGFESNSKP